MKKNCESFADIDKRKCDYCGIETYEYYKIPMEGYIFKNNEKQIVYLTAIRCEGCEA